ncbi:hypothetical protein NM208_g1865 [Fusarium decemcellulare]|uniref:Uncharacterized protein n=1 Tax=Fusarium decemcellulare TaxID=57161 RepID=A0ACC1SUU8_9HYPO|nr:hypothetical protein NM208_g1865 [Fusarium decemcellulare]
MVVKLTYAIHQKPYISLEKFQKQWREVHGPLVSSLQTPLKLVKYVQAHRTPGSADDAVRAARPQVVDKNETPWAVVDEYYFDFSSIKDFHEHLFFPGAQDAWRTLFNHEKGLVDFDRSQLFFVAEHLQVATDAAAQTLASEYNSVNLAFAFVEFSEGSGAMQHWICNHAPLIRRYAAALGFDKYIQNHPRDGGEAALSHLREERGIKEGRYSSYASFWINERAATNDAAMQRAAKEVSADEVSGFVKAKTGNCLIAKELVFVDQWRV